MLAIYFLCACPTAAAQNVTTRDECQVPDFVNLSQQRRDLLDHLLVGENRWNKLMNLKRLGFLNVSGAVLEVPLVFSDAVVEGEYFEDAMRQDRVFLTNADLLDRQAIVEGSKFSPDIGGGGSHPNYPDSHRRNVFHKSLQLSFSHTRIKKLEADVDIFNPNLKGGYGLGLILHSFEVLFHNIDKALGGTGLTNPYNVSFRRNWDCSTR
jgi:hypothetical protein